MEESDTEKRKTWGERSVIARIAGRGRPKAEEIDTVIGEYIHPSALLCTDKPRTTKKFGKTKGLKHETVNERQKQVGYLNSINNL